MPVSCRGLSGQGQLSNSFARVWQQRRLEQDYGFGHVQAKVFCKHTQSVANAIPGLRAVEF